uniref:Beta-lactamase-related domain-containing protein n=1 Tax=Plectus sambesii TaxID=2011161 RepID=A0A914VQA1_9BILA
MSPFLRVTVPVILLLVIFVTSAIICFVSGGGGGVIILLCVILLALCFYLPVGARLRTRRYFMPRPLAFHFDGDCAERFSKVQKVFEKNFRDGWEVEGAAFCVYLDGEKVIDIWGGYADSSSHRRWKSDTMTTCFSSTKGVAAICFAMLVDRGLVSYDDLVAKHWPEFGKNGKENITIKTLLSHQGGLAYVDGVILADDITDHTRMSKILEDQLPNWPPGEKTGYHALTFGWLLDQLIRRIDPEKRSVSRFFREEIGDPNDIEFYIGLPPALDHKVARLSNTTIKRMLREAFEQPVILKMVWYFLRSSKASNFHRIGKNVAWMGTDITMFNNPELRAMEIPAANGVGTARGLAKINSLVAEGKIIRQETLDIIKEPVLIEEYDTTLGFTESKGWGLHYTKSPQNDWIFGHPGMGGQNVKIDLKNRLAFAYISNGLKAGVGDYTGTFKRLQTALYECLSDTQTAAKL